MKKIILWIRRPLSSKIDSIAYRLNLSQFVQNLILKILKKLSKSVFFRPALFLFHRSQPYVIAPTREGLSYIISTSDLCIGRLTFEDQFSYESEMLDIAFKELDRDSFGQILDIGSNIGSISMYSVKAAYAKSAIAFEPDEANYNLLNINIKLNNLENQIKTRRVALCDQDNIKLKFSKSLINHGDHRINFFDRQPLDVSGREFVFVEASTLESFRDEIHSSNLFVVIDAQGSEGHILQGFPSLRGSCIPLLIEFHPEGLKDTKGFQKYISALLSSGNKNLIDMHNPTNILPLSETSFLEISNGLGGNVPETDLLIF